MLCPPAPSLWYTGVEGSTLTTGHTMTLNITISNDQNQAYGLSIIEKSVQPNSDGTEEVSSVVTAELQPGECINLVMWDGKDFLLKESPKST